MRSVFSIVAFLFLLGLVGCREVLPNSSDTSQPSLKEDLVKVRSGITIPSSEDVVFHDGSIGKDNIVYLMAAGAERNSDMRVTNYGFPKHFWINNFNDQSDFFRWHVNVPEGAEYRVWALLEAKSEIPLELSVENSSSTLRAVTNRTGWDKLELGTIYIPAGEQKVRLVRNGNVSGNIQIKSLELIREDKVVDYEERVGTFKQDTTWLAESGYGVMFQYGAWGYPQNGDRKSINQGAEDFDVDRFITMVKDMGASYVIWSITWHQFWMQAPIQSFDSIMGHSNFTSDRDLVGEIAQACQDNGIRFMLYYHQGLQEEPTWAEMQNWPTEFSARGTGDRSDFFDNWCTVIEEIGNRYGENLDGFFFDDGCVYYPAPFERLGEAARAGNPNRLISYNPWVSTRITEFQDVNFGEGHHGGSVVGTPEKGGDGVLLSGPNKGLLDHGMFIMEQDWGVHKPNMTIQNRVSKAQAINWLTHAEQYRIPLSFNLMMYEDGTVSQDSLEVLHTLKNRGSLPEASNLINDTETEIFYQGNWLRSSRRGVGDYMDDIHYTEENGASFEFSFSGTGIEYISEKYSDMGEVDIYLDGVFQSTVNCYNKVRLSQQVIYSKYGLPSGNHTLRVVKRTGDFMILDALSVTTEDSYFIISNRTDGLFLRGGGSRGSAVEEAADSSSFQTLWMIVDVGNGYKTLKNGSSGLVLNGGGGYNGYPITEWTNVISPNLEWLLIESSPGYMKIQNRTSGYVLNGGGGYDGFPVTEWKDQESTNLEWKIRAYR